MIIPFGAMIIPPTANHFNEWMLINSIRYIPILYYIESQSLVWANACSFMAMVYVIYSIAFERVGANKMKGKINWMLWI